MPIYWGDKEYYEIKAECLLQSLLSRNRGICFISPESEAISPYNS